jgi:hypothetical protein
MGRESEIRVHIPSLLKGKRSRKTNGDLADQKAAGSL